MRPSSCQPPGELVGSAGQHVDVLMRQPNLDSRPAAGSDSVLIVPGKSHGGAWRDGTAAYQTAAAALLTLDREDRRS